ncbi:MAG TPA: metal ABC transporter permease [Flavobacteriaceae bacterium]|nr:metal ABC transporter permease [Flavobacteriaceae bacterium]
MILPQIEIQIIAALVAMACSILGVFLVLRKMAMISDAISHSILPGIVVGFFITQDLNAPLLIFFAALTGVITVILVEYIQKTELVKEDTAIGLVFPVLFSLGIILITKNASDIHLDVDAVLLGELAFAPFDRIVINEIDLGPKSLWVIGIILLIIIILVGLFYKELKISTFDPSLAAALGFSPVLIHYGLMTVSSVTIVGAFDAVGAILVVALIIAPAAMAYLLTEKLKIMLVLSVLVGVIAAITGYQLAHLLDASIAGSIATILGLFFVLVYLFAPKKGIVARYYRTGRQHLEISLLSLLLHISRHREKEERHVDHLQDHLNWNKSKAKKLLHHAQETGLIEIQNQIISLSPKGKEFAEASINFILENQEHRIALLKRELFLKQ